MLLLRNLFLLLLFSCSFAGFSQDSTANQSSDRSFQWGIEGLNRWQGPIGESQSRAVRLAPYTQNARQTIYGINYNPSEALDQPLFHNALQLRLRAKSTLAEGVNLYGDIVAEHRGVSYGMYDANNMIAFPQLLLDIERNFNLLKKEFKFLGQFGNLNDFLPHNGLMVYNMDVQGFSTEFRYKKVFFRYIRIGDLINGIGLGLDEWGDWTIGLTDYDLNANWKLKALHLSATNLQRSLVDHVAYHVSARVASASGIEVYAQVGSQPYKYNEAAWGDTPKYAGVVGVSTEKEKGRLLFGTTLNARYYGRDFNRYFKDVSVSYRPSRFPNNYAQTIGDQLYPVHLFERPFSQWAVYTEYQGPLGRAPRNTAGLEWWGTAHWNFLGEMLLMGTIDMNLIAAEGESPYLYPFAEVGVGWEPVKDSYMAVTLSNKGMNLDVHYPTFYQYEAVHLGLLIRRKIPNWGLKY